MTDTGAVKTFSNAINKRDFDTVRQLLADGSIDINGRLPLDSAPFNFPTPLIAGAGDIELIELLINSGADVNGTNTTGETACHVAAWNGDTVRTAASDRSLEPMIAFHQLVDDCDDCETLSQTFNLRKKRFDS